MKIVIIEILQLLIIKITAELLFLGIDMINVYSNEEYYVRDEIFLKYKTLLLMGMLILHND